MRIINTLIIDDEPLARVRIAKLLKCENDINLVGECKNGREAIGAIHKEKPDLIFLDIQMPDFNGFEVVDSLKQNKPFVIFITAFDEYALKAFDVKATDYLLKPFDDDRFYEALSFAKNQINVIDQVQVHQKMVKLMDEHLALIKDPFSPIILKDKVEDVVLRPDQILWVEADGNYVKIYTDHKRYFHRSTLHDLFGQLPSGIFMRVHRSILVNLKAITKVTYKSNNQFIIQLNNGDSLLTSRGYKNDLKEYLQIHPELV